MTWGKARKKPIVIEFREAEANFFTTVPAEKIDTREGALYGYPGKDFIIKGVRGEIYPIGKDIFKETYDVVEDIPSSGGTQAPKETMKNV